MGRSATGRMINTDISMSAKVASLSPEALSLFALLIPHFNAHGKMLANPHTIKGTVAPLIEWLTVDKIGKCLTEISAKTNVKWWQDEKGLNYLQSLNWSEHQELRSDRLGTDRLPDYPGENQFKGPTRKASLGLLPDHSRSNPGALPHEVEVEIEGEGEEKGAKKPSSDALRLSGLLAELIAGNNPQNRTIQPTLRGKSIERWAADIDRMFRIDGRDQRLVEEVIRWCQADDFWCCNILSGNKLRKQFDKLILAMQRGSQKGQPSGESPKQYGRLDDGTRIELPVGTTRGLVY